MTTSYPQLPSRDSFLARGVILGVFAVAIGFQLPGMLAFVGSHAVTQLLFMGDGGRYHYPIDPLIIFVALLGVGVTVHEMVGLTFHRAVG